MAKKCDVCGAPTQKKDHEFCYDCYYNLDIKRCEKCNRPYNSVGSCMCETFFNQCSECGRWSSDEDDCVCVLLEKIDELEAGKKTNKTYVKRTQLLTEPEQIFFKKLQQAIDIRKYYVTPQTSLRQMVERTTEKWRRANELNRDIDFAIIDKNTTEIILTIEYDDSTHTRPNRQKRDAKVEEISTDAGLRVLRFSRDDNMTIDFIKGRLADHL